MSDPIPLTLPRFSHSQLTTYMDCGERYRLERRHKLGGSTSWALVGGSAFHSWTEVYDKGFPVEPSYFLKLLADQVRETLASDRNTAVSEAEIRPTGRASKEWPNKRDRAWWEHHGPIFCQQYIDWRADPTNDVLGPETEYQVELGVDGVLGGLEVKGFIDRISWENPLGAPVVVDLKTGKEPGTLLQLGTYAVLIKEQLDIDVKYGAFYLAEKGELSKVHNLSAFNREYIESLYEQAKRGLSAGVFLPNPNSFCSTCEVKKHCGLYGGRPPLMSGVPLLEPGI